MLSLTVFPDDTKQKIAVFFPPKIAYMFSKLLWTTIRSRKSVERLKILLFVVNERDLYWPELYAMHVSSQ